MRSSYGNADDAAVLGFFFANNRIGLDLNYASDKIPGVLVKSDVWDYLQCNLRFRLTNGEFALYAGLRYEHSILQTDRSSLNLDGHQKATVNSLLFTIGLAVNSVKRR
jgi:hypothetical protein